MKRYIALFALLLMTSLAQASGSNEHAADQTPDNTSAASDASTQARNSDDIRHLPLQEVPASRAGDTLAFLITGDGGWAPLDRNVSAELAHRGISVVGLSSLKYFWHSREPTLAARDVARALRHYMAAWHRSRVALIGYSFGADVLPFIVNRLPRDVRSHLVSINLLGPSPNATFTVSAGEALHPESSASRPVAPELSRIHGVPVLCVHGDGELQSLCPSLPSNTATSVLIGVGHHFGDEYGALADHIAKLAAHPGS